MAETDIDLVGSAKSGVQTGEAFGKAIGHLFFLFSRPLGLVTQVFFRKDFGERYFTVAHAFGAYILIAAATFVTYRVPYPRELWGATQRTFVTQEMIGNIEAIRQTSVWVGVAWVAVFFLAHVQQSFGVWRRHKAGGRWHSRCMGVPRVAIITETPQYVLGVALTAGALYLGYSGFAILFMVSVAQTAAADRWAAKEMYHRVLDSIDSEIESKNLGEAIQKRLSPQDAEGLHAQLPNRIGAHIKKRSQAVTLTTDDQNRKFNTVNTHSTQGPTL